MTQQIYEPFVSVVLPTYNGLATLPDAVRSILNQTYQNFELIVVDDASTEDIAAGLLEFIESNKLRILRKEKNCGLAAALNDGISLARGNYIARMDDDDYSLPSRLAEQVKFLESRPEIDLVGTGVALYDAGLNFIRDHYFPAEHEEIVRFFSRGNPLAHPTVMFRRHFIQRAGGYDASLRRMEDLDLWGRMARSSRFANLQQVLLRHRVRSAKTLLAVPIGIRVRLYNGWRLGYLMAAIPWIIVYVAVEVMRHWGYRQRTFRKTAQLDIVVGFLD